MSRLQKVSTALVFLLVGIFFVLLFFKNQINNSNLVFLYPVTLLLGLFFAGISETGNVKSAFKSPAFILFLSFMFIALVVDFVRK